MSVKHRKSRKSSGNKGGGRGKLLGGISLFSLGLGLVGGIVISHIFRSTVDKVWGEIPGLNQVKANYGYYY
jgi:hypothetical protein